MIKIKCRTCGKEVVNPTIIQKTCESKECQKARNKAYHKAYKKTDKYKAYDKAYYQRKKNLKEKI